MPFLNVSVRSSVAIIVNTVFCKRMNESILMGNNDKCDPSGKGMKQEVEGQGHARLKTAFTDNHTGPDFSCSLVYLQSILR